jgi:prevent-host-death family protein
MRTVTIHEAKTHLSRLIDEVLNGEAIVISRGNTPVAKLMPLAAGKRPRRSGGAAKAIIAIADDFDADMEDFKEYRE